MGAHNTSNNPRCSAPVSLHTRSIWGKGKRSMGEGTTQLYTPLASAAGGSLSWPVWRGNTSPLTQRKTVFVLMQMTQPTAASVLPAAAYRRATSKHSAGQAQSHSVPVIRRHNNSARFNPTASAVHCVQLSSVQHTTSDGPQASHVCMQCCSSARGRSVPRLTVVATLRPQCQ